MLIIHDKHFPEVETLKYDCFGKKYGIQSLSAWFNLMHNSKESLYVQKIDH